MEVAEGMDIRCRTKIIPHNKNIMEIQEEAAECHHQIEGEEDRDQRKDRPLQTDIEVVMIREEVVKAEDIQMEDHRREKEVGLHHWSGQPLQIPNVSRAENPGGFMLMIHSERTTATPEAIKNTPTVPRSNSMGQSISHISRRKEENINV